MQARNFIFFVLSAVEGADDTSGSPGGEAVGQPGALRGHGAGT